MTLHTSRRRGVALVYATVMMVALIGVGSLAVDLGRVQVAKTQLQGATDAAARYAVTGIVNNTAVQKAIWLASQNTVDGSPLVLQPSDITVGTWATGRCFSAGGVSPNAVRITAHRSQSRGTSVPLLFAMAIGQRSCEVNAHSTAVLNPAVTTVVTDKGTFDPYLAGAADGTNASTDDWAGPNSPNGVDCRPPATTALNLTGGAKLTFSFSGGVRNNPDFENYGPDGNTGWIISHEAGDQNGIANVTMPINAVLGVFLDDSVPSSTAAPQALDFSTASSRDFSSLSPQLKQPFFIGDGKDSHGNSQNFIVPTGATHFFLCTMDGYEWSNNLGYFKTNVTSSSTITLVE